MNEKDAEFYKSFEIRSPEQAADLEKYLEWRKSEEGQALCTGRYDAEWIKFRDAPIEEFNHDKLQSLSQEEITKFKILVNKLIIWNRTVYHVAVSSTPTHTDDELRRGYESILKHLAALEKLFIKSDPLKVLGLEWNPDDIDQLRNYVIKFPQTVSAMKYLLLKLLSEGAYKKNGEERKQRVDIASSVHKLLTDFKLRPTLTPYHLWHSLTYHIILQSTGYEEGDDNIINLLRDAKGRAQHCYPRIIVNWQDFSIIDLLITYTKTV